MGTHQPIRKTVTPEIPDKLYFRIGDVARLCEVPTYVLRFWETEFPQLKPNKGGTGQRLYRRRDVELALRIKSLLYDQGYTIPGARQVFKNESAARSAEALPIVETMPGPVSVPSSPAQDSGAVMRQQARLRNLREEMAGLLASLSDSAESGPSSITDKTPGKPELKVHALRPKLVLEPRPAAVKREDEKLRQLRTQQDLFADDSWPEPPAAS